MDLREFCVRHQIYFTSHPMPKQQQVAGEPTKFADYCNECRREATPPLGNTQSCKWYSWSGPRPDIRGLVRLANYERVRDRGPFTERSHEYILLEPASGLLFKCEQMGSGTSAYETWLVTPTLKAFILPPTFGP